MRKTEEILICAGAIDKYGKVHQLLKLAEECGELVHAIMRYLETREMDTPGDAERANMFAEAADVEILLSQLRVMYPYHTIDMRKEDTLCNLSERVSGWRDPELEAVAERLRVKAREEASPRKESECDPLEGCEIREG